MDPNLFHLDWERTGEVLIAIVILSFILERALALLVENRHFIARFDGRGVKEILALAASFVVCLQWDFDAVSMIILAEKTSLLGKLVTAAVIAGGSKASIKLFHDVMGMKPPTRTQVEAEAKELADAKAAAAKPGGVL